MVYDILRFTGYFLPFQKALYVSVNPLLDMCDEHSVMMLRMNLPEAQREIFKTLYEQYSKYHKYTGRV